MNVFFYNIFNFFFGLVMALSILLILNFAKTGGYNYHGWIALFIITYIPNYVLFKIRSYFNNKFEVQKYLSEKRHKRALLVVRQREEQKRSNVSTQSERRNIDPLIDAIREELLSRKAYLTPYVFGRTQSLIVTYQETNKVVEVIGAGIG